LAKSKRTRIEFEDSHGVPHSQPATEGGRNGYWPIPSSIQVQESRSIPRPVVRSVPATNTTGDLIMVGSSRCL
jgi:hypothetical protein